MNNCNGREEAKIAKTGANTTESALSLASGVSARIGGAMARWRIGLLSPRLRVTVIAAVALGVLMLTGTVSEAAPSLGYTSSYVPGVSGAISVAVDPLTNTIYLAEQTANQIAVVDGTTNSVIKTISTGGSPDAVAVDPATDTVYAAVAPSGGAASSVIDVIDGKSGTITGSIAVPSAGLGFDSTTNTLVAVDADVSGVTLISAATNSVVATVSTGTTSLYWDVAIDQSTGVVWVVRRDGTLLGISEATDSVVDTLTIPGGPIGVAVNPSTDTVYVGTDFNGLTVVDGATATIAATIAMGQVDAFAVDPSADVVYASTGAGLLGTTWIVDGTNNTVADIIHRGGYAAAFDSATGAVYEANLAGAAPQVGAWVVTPSAANALSPVIYSAAAATFSTGRAGSVALLINALPTATIAESGALPPGVTFSSGALSGTPAPGTGGSYPITFTASNGTPPDYSQSFVLTVDQPVVITSAPAATFETGVASAFDLSATGYPPPTFFVNGSPSPLPHGVSISQTATGGWQLAGTPAPGTGGVYNVLLQADDRVTNTTQPFTITVDQPTAFVSAAKAFGRPGRRFRFVIRTTGFPVAKLSEHGRLPKGMRLRPRTNGTALLVGSPALSDRHRTYELRFVAANSSGAASSAVQIFRLRIG